jgi:hypothetical protein
MLKISRLIFIDASRNHYGVLLLWIPESWNWHDPIVYGQHPFQYNNAEVNYEELKAIPPNLPASFRHS